MKIILVMCLACFGFLGIVFSILFLIKLVRKKADQKLEKNLPGEIIEILSASSSRRKVTEDDIRKVKKISIFKMIGVGVLVVVLFFMMVLRDGIQSMFGEAALFVFVLAIIFTCATIILLIIDKMKMGALKNAWIARAYVLRADPFRGYSLTISYYDFLQRKITTRTIQIDNTDVQWKKICKEDYMDIVVSEKGNRVKYACVFDLVE